MGGAGKAGGKKVPWSSIFSWAKDAAKAVYDVAKVASNIFSKVWLWVKTIIQKIWGFLSEVYNKVKDFISPVLTEIKNVYEGYIKPALQWVTKTLKTVIDTVDYVYRTVIDYIDKVTGGLFKTVMKLHDDATAFKDKAIRLIRTVDKKLAQKIEEKASDVIDYTLGWARRWHNELHQEITKVYLELRGELNKAFWAIQDVITKIEKTVKPIERLVTPTIEKPKLLSRDTIINSTQKHGKELFQELFKRQTGPPEIIEIKVPPPTWVDKLADQTADELLQEERGFWSDSLEHLQRWEDYIITEKDPGEFAFNEELIPPDERAEIQEAEKFVREKGIHSEKDVDDIINDLNKRLRGEE